MKIVIDIPEEDYEKIKKTSFVENTETMFNQSSEDRKGSMMLFRVIDAIKDATPLEAQPTDKCKGCYYNDGETHAECVVCDKEAQPTDAVSREEAIFIVDEYAIGGETWAQRKDCVELLKQLPSVQPQPCEDAVSRQDLIDKATSWDSHFADSERAVSLKDIMKMSPVTPQRPKGKWEYVQYDGNPNIGNWHCSECNRIVCGAITAVNPVYAYKYCPNCGAKMSGGGEDETDN